MERLYWRCNKVTCPSYIYTDMFYNSVEHAMHNHSFDEIKAKKILLNEALKKAAFANENSSGNVWLNIEKEFKGLSFNYVQARKVVVEIRNKNNFSYANEYEISQ